MEALKPTKTTTLLTIPTRAAVIRRIVVVVLHQNPILPFHRVALAPSEPVNRRIRRALQLRKIHNHTRTRPAHKRRVVHAAGRYRRVRLQPDPLHASARIQTPAHVLTRTRVAEVGIRVEHRRRGGAAHQCEYVVGRHGKRGAPVQNEAPGVLHGGARGHERVGDDESAGGVVDGGDGVDGAAGGGEVEGSVGGAFDVAGEIGMAAAAAGAEGEFDGDGAASVVACGVDRGRGEDDQEQCEENATVSVNFHFVEVLEKETS